MARLARRADMNNACLAERAPVRGGKGAVKTYDFDLAAVYEPATNVNPEALAT